MTNGVFPNGIFSWTNVENDTSTVFANDPNSIAADLIGVESTLGTTPQVEKSPASGGAPVAFASVDARISAVQNGQQLAVAQLSNNALLVANGQSAGTNYGQWNTYTSNYDPFGCYNGNDITVPVTGWYSVTAGQLWDWWNTGYCMMSLWINGTMNRQDIWHWDFVGNTRIGDWQQPNNTVAGPVLRPGSTDLSWQGQLQSGTRIRILSENGTSDAQHRTYNMDLAVSLLRTI